MRYGAFLAALSLALALALAALPASAQSLPKGWGLATTSQVYSVKSDLNGDGIIDKAVLATDGDETKLLVFLSGKQGATTMDLMTTRHDAASCTVTVLPPGKYRTACGKGYMDCRKGEPEVLDTKAPTLAFTDENVQVAFLFGKSGVRKIWLSD